LTTKKDFQLTAHSSRLTLNCLAIGSLPHKSVEDAIKLVSQNFQIPFWPQLSKLNKNEDMIFQFLENMPGICTNDEKTYLENDSDEFFEQLECFFIDWEEVTLNKNLEKLEKYGISEKNSATVVPFLSLIKKTLPDFAKGQIVGPFTLATSLTDKEGKCAFYDETLREVIIKTLCLKALWQINEIKKASPETTPIIFIDEPSMSQLGTSAFITISKDEVVDMIKEVSDLIKQNGAISAIHCCGKCDWSIPIQADVDIINLDGYFFAQNLSTFSKEVKTFLQKGGKIAWGIIPTLDKDALEKADLTKMISKFEQAIGFLEQKGLNKDLLINNTLITPSCGAGSLTVELAQKAMNLTNELSKELKEKYK